MASKAFLRELRRKHHLGEFRTTKKSKSTPKTSKRRKGGYTMARKARKGGKKSGMFSGLMGKVAGVGGYVLFESVIEPMIPIQGDILDIVELGVGLYLSKKGGIIGEVGKTAVIINTYSLMRKYLAPMVQQTTANLFSGSNTF
jgi:hypothetical protein